MTHLKKRCLTLRSTQPGLVQALREHSEDWNSLIKVETMREERAVTQYQPSSSSGADGKTDSKPVPHQVQGERAGPLGPTTLEGLQVFHESQWDKIRSAMDLDFWAKAEKHLVELEQASTRFLGQNWGRLSLDQER